MTRPARETSGKLRAFAARAPATGLASIFHKLVTGRHPGNIPIVDWKMNLQIYGTEANSQKGPRWSWAGSQIGNPRLMIGCCHQSPFCHHLQDQSRDSFYARNHAESPAKSAELLQRASRAQGSRLFSAVVRDAASKRQAWSDCGCQVAQQSWRPSRTQFPWRRLSGERVSLSLRSEF